MPFKVTIVAEGKSPRDFVVNVDDAQAAIEESINWIRQNVSGRQIVKTEVSEWRDVVIIDPKPDNSSEPSGIDLSDLVGGTVVGVAKSLSVGDSLVVQAQDGTRWKVVPTFLSYDKSHTSATYRAVLAIVPEQPGKGD